MGRLNILCQPVGIMNASRLVRAATTLSHPPPSSLLVARAALSTAQQQGRGGHSAAQLGAAAAPPPRFPPRRPAPAALRRLARDGSDALRPRLVLSPYPDDPTAVMYRNDTPTLNLAGASSTATSDIGAAGTAAPSAEGGAATSTESAAAAAALDAAESASSSLSSYDVRRSWHKPKVSRRKAQVLRKAAIRGGTYGTFHPETGEGWDASWDAELFLRHRGGGGGATGVVGGGASSGDDVGPNHDAAPEHSQVLGRYRLTAPKKPKRQRTREQRATLVDRNLADMDARVEEYHAARHASKPPNTFENLYKRLMRVKK